MLSAQRFQEGVEAVARPLEDLAQAIDGHTIGAVGHPAHGGLATAAAGWAYAPSPLRVRAPQASAQRQAYDGIPRDLTGVQLVYAVEISDSGVDNGAYFRKANTQELELCLCLHAFFLSKRIHYIR